MSLLCGFGGFGYSVCIRSELSAVRVMVLRSGDSPKLSVRELELANGPCPRATSNY